MNDKENKAGIDLPHSVKTGGHQRLVDDADPSAARMTKSKAAKIRQGERKYVSIEALTSPNSAGKVLSQLHPFGRQAPFSNEEKRVIALAVSDGLKIAPTQVKTEDGKSKPFLVDTRYPIFISTGMGSAAIRASDEQGNIVDWDISHVQVQNTENTEINDNPTIDGKHFQLFFDSKFIHIVVEHIENTGRRKLKENKSQDKDVNSEASDKRIYRRSSERPRPDLPGGAEANRLKQQFKLRMDPKLIGAVDKAAAAAGMTRQEWVERALKVSLE